MNDLSRANQELFEEISRLEQRIKELEQSKTNITDSIQREERLGNSEINFGDLSENPVAGVYLMQEDGILRYVNLRCAEIFGYKVEEVIDIIRVDNVIFPEDWPTVRDSLRKRISGQLPSHHYEFRIVTKNKDVKYVEAYSSSTLYKGRSAIIGILLDITDRKRADDALRKSESRLREVQEMAHLGSWRWDAKTGAVEWSGEMYKIFQLDPREFTPRMDSILSLSPWPEDHVRYNELIWRAMESHEKGGYEQRFLRPDKSLGYYYSTFQGQYDEDDNLVSLVGSLMDITDRKQMEETLKESESKYRLLADNAADVIFIFDLDMKFQYTSPSVTKLRGFSPEDLFGTSVSQSVTSESSQNVRKVIQEELELEKTGTADPNRTRIVELEMFCKDGSTVWTEVKASFLRNESGHPTGVIGISRDITERKEAEKELRKSEEKFKRAFYTSPDAININRLSDGMCISINKGFSELTGYSQEDVLGKTSIDLNIWDDPNDRAKLVQGLREKGKVENLEARFRLKSGEIRCGMMSATLIDLEGVPHILSITRDITQRRQSEEEKERLESQLFQAQKMEAIGTLTGGIAHDFNNILTSLLGYAGLMQMKMDTTNPLRLYVDQILSATHTAADLVRSLLAFSRKAPITLTSMNINNGIKTTKKLLERLLTEDIELRTVLTLDETIVMADKTQIDQILFNLVTNARDAMPKGGTLTIETDIVEIDGEFTRIHGFGEPGRYVLVKVSDTGMGMDEATQEKIFDPFFTTKEVGKGTGLGLATVYGIVKQHGGYITVHSEPNQGSAFHIYLPAVRVVVEQEEEETVSIKGGNERILIAEDNEGVRILITEALQQYGYTTIEAIDGEDAVQKFKEHRDLDLIIVDSVMPKKNGREVSEEIQRTDPHIRVIFTSGYTKDIVLDKGIGEKEFDFIAKPLSPAVLLQKVREVLDT